MELVYLDNNATTRLDPKVVEAMLPYLTEQFGNPSSVHRLGQHARAAIDEAREQVANFVGCRDRELTFTGSGTEASNTAIRGLVNSRKRPKVVTSAVEHDATAEVVSQLSAAGVESVQVPVDSAGQLDLDCLREVVDDSVACVSLIWGNNETGVILDVATAADICRHARVPLHIDATQAVGKLPVDLAAVGCDAATLSPHKFHGPKGVGLLYLRRGLRIEPLILGGPQERDRRGGTENVAGIVGTGIAATLAAEHLEDMPRVQAMRDRLETRLLDAIPVTRINGCRAPRLPNTTNVAFEGLHAEAILLMLSEQGICASAGAACSSGSLDPSRVLLAMGIEDTWAFGSIRLSLSRQSTDAEIDKLCDALPPIVDRLRQVLPTAF